jgi:hypothetical protein
MADYDNRTPRRQADWSARIGGEIGRPRGVGSMRGDDVRNLPLNVLVRDRQDDDQHAEARAFNAMPGNSLRHHQDRIAAAADDAAYRRLEREYADATRRHNENVASRQHLARHGRRDAMDPGPIEPLRHNEDGGPDTGLHGPSQGSIYRRYR